MKVCDVEGCEGKPHARGYCSSHYARWRRTGSVDGDWLRKFHDPDISIKHKTRAEGNCIVWTGFKNPEGYGRLTINNRAGYAHRYVWAKANGPIPEGMVIDHICHNRACVRLEHLRLVTNSQNSSYRGYIDRETSTGERNVYRNKKGFMVRLMKDGKDYYAGTYGSISEAARVAAARRAELFGNFAGEG